MKPHTHPGPSRRGDDQHSEFTADDVTADGTLALGPRRPVVIREQQQAVAVTPREHDHDDPADDVTADASARGLTPDEVEQLTATLAGLSPEARRRVASAWAQSRRP